MSMCAMPEKKAPLGICDLCEEPFPPGVSVYTTKGKPRLFCSLACRATANSRAGAPIRSKKAKERVRRGEWQNPAEFQSDEERREYARRGGRVRARQHREALAAGTWQNPADAPGAREKLSRPRRHVDNPVLHSALEKLRQRFHIADLTLEEAEAHRAYRRELRAGRREYWRAYYGDSYHRRMASAEGRERERQKWERQRERRRAREPNQALRLAREQAGYSQQRLAKLLGVTQTAVGNWERVSARPSVEMQRQVADLLGATVEEIFASE
jgi:DNA-binding XRE family transcriptional regulator